MQTYLLHKNSLSILYSNGSVDVTRYSTKMRKKLNRVAQ